MIVLTSQFDNLFKKEYIATKVQPHEVVQFNSPILLKKSSPFKPFSDQKNQRAKPKDLLKELIQKTRSLLLSVSSILIFDLVPDKIIIDENKVTIIHNDWFGVQNIHSVLIENISYVEVNTNLLSASIEIIDSTNPRDPIHLQIFNLPKKQAARVRKLIQGLVQAKRSGLDFSKFTPRELDYFMEQLGEASGENE